MKKSFNAFLSSIFYRSTVRPALLLAVIMGINSVVALKTPATHAAEQTQAEIAAQLQQQTITQQKQKEEADRLAAAKAAANQAAQQAAATCQAAKKAKKKKKKKKLKKLCMAQTLAAQQAQQRLKSFQGTVDSAILGDLFVGNLKIAAIADAAKSLGENIKDAYEDLLKDSNDPCVGKTQFEADLAEAIKDMEEEKADAVKAAKPLAFTEAAVNSEHFSIVERSKNATHNKDLAANEIKLAGESKAIALEGFELIDKYEPLLRGLKWGNPPGTCSSSSSSSSSNDDDDDDRPPGSGNNVFSF